MSLNKTKDRRRDRKRAKEGNRRGGTISMLVEPYFQVRLGAMMFVLNLIFGLLISGVVYYYVMDIYHAVSAHLQFTQDQAVESWRQFFQPFAVCLSLVAVFFLLTFFIIIRYTHRIYGPLVSIHAYLDELLSEVESRDVKKIPSLQLRSSDQLVTLAEKLNKLATFLNHQQGGENTKSNTKSNKTKNREKQKGNQGTQSVKKAREVKKKGVKKA